MQFHSSAAALLSFGFRCELLGLFPSNNAGRKAQLLLGSSFDHCDQFERFGCSYLIVRRCVRYSKT